MPAAHLHDTAALHALSLIEGAPPPFSEAQMRVFLLGAQGPDILFYHGILPPWRSHKPNFAGIALHQQSGALLLSALLPLAQSPIQRAWTLGYICHWAVDASCHPYVLSRADECKNAHGLLEMGADAELYAAGGGQGEMRHMPYIAGISRQERYDIARALSPAIGAALPGRRVSARQIVHAIGDGDRLYGFFHSADGSRFRAVRRLEKLIGKPTLITAHMPALQAEIADPLNLARAPWGDGRTDTLPERAALASEQAAQAIRLALSFWADEISLAAALAPMGHKRMCDGTDDVDGRT